MNYVLFCILKEYGIAKYFAMVASKSYYPKEQVPTHQSKAELIIMVTWSVSIMGYDKTAA